MNIPVEPAKLEKPSDIFGMSPYDLVLWSAATGMDEWKGSLAKAEQTRRQTEAVNKFNRASSRLALIMICVALTQLIVAFTNNK